MPGREVEMLISASANNRLAKANLSHAYIDRGFLGEAERIAREAVSMPEDPETDARVASALARIQEERTSEKKKEQAVLEQAGIERLFRVDYAEAVLLGVPEDFGGIYRTPYGDLRIWLQGGHLLGEASITTEVLGGFNQLFRSGPENLRGVRIKTVRLDAEMTGRAGVFHLSSEEKGDFNIGQPNQSETRTGLLFIGRKGTQLSILEISGELSKVFIAPKCE
ncbi:MAG: tetratricopeptide repeat protein [Candidatus Binataceae bacterium]